MSTVLVLDADRVTRRTTISAVRYGGFEVTSTRTLQEARRKLRRNRFAAVIVDPGAGADATGIVEGLRAQTDAPIIAVSASDDHAYKVALLDAGADDYVTRPFDPEELFARVRAVSRRVARLEDMGPIVTVDFTMQLADRRLFRSNETEVTLSPTEWKLIEVLVQHTGHLVTREELLTSVWGPGAANKAQYLRVFMAGIRHKVEPDPARPRYFVTVPGLGLRFDPQGGGIPEETRDPAQSVLPQCRYE